MFDFFSAALNTDPFNQMFDGRSIVIGATCSVSQSVCQTDTHAQGPTRLYRWITGNVDDVVAALALGASTVTTMKTIQKYGTRSWTTTRNRSD